MSSWADVSWLKIYCCFNPHHRPIEIPIKRAKNRINVERKSVQSNVVRPEKIRIVIHWRPIHSTRSVRVVSPGWLIDNLVETSLSLWCDWGCPGKTERINGWNFIILQKCVPCPIVISIYLSLLQLQSSSSIPARLDFTT